MRGLSCSVVLVSVFGSCHKVNWPKKSMGCGGGGEAALARATIFASKVQEGSHVGVSSDNGGKPITPETSTEQIPQHLPSFFPCLS